MGGRKPPEINIVCPAITPTLGDELVINGTFDTDLTGWSDVSVPDGSAVWVDAGNPAGACDLTRVGANNGHIEQEISVTDEEWYQIKIEKEGANNLFLGVSTKDNSILGAYGAAGIATYTAPISVASIFLGVNSGAALTRWIDNFSLKLLTFSTLYSLLGERKGTNGTFRCAPTIANNTATGMIINYKDDDNFVLAVVNKAPSTAQAQLYSKISGDYTKVITGNITYGAGYALQVVANNGEYSLYYNGTQVGTTQTISETTLGKSVLGFNTVAGDTVGTVITSSNISP